jgi:reverse transcriptase-like protein/aspartyl protease
MADFEPPRMIIPEDIPRFCSITDWIESQLTSAEGVELSGVQVDRNKYPTLQRNAAQVKGNQRVLPEPIVMKVTVNGHPARALLDSGSLEDFVSTMLADQLGVKKTKLDAPLALQLAVQGSRSRVNAVATAQLKYQGIEESRTFDVINLNGYDLILGTPWMRQHRVCLGFNPTRIVIGSNELLSLKAESGIKLMVDSLSPGDREIENAHEELRRYAEPLCKDVAETDLPPLRAINHTILLIDEKKTYPWRASWCPEAFRAQCAERKHAYISSGRWTVTYASDTVPMLFIPKPGTNPPELQTVVDLQERNGNTYKTTSPLPDVEGMLRHTASKPFRTALDLKSAYEQIRIVPEHVKRTAVMTPDGNVVSQIIQIGDCTATATYQALMNYLFSPSFGRLMGVYLDDIVIYSDDLDDHVQHVSIVLDILWRERLYLCENKLHFVQPTLKLLGRVIVDQGIRIDPNVVADTLSRLHFNDSSGTLRSRSDFTYHDVVDGDMSVVDKGKVDVLPLLAGMEAGVATRRCSRHRWQTDKVREQPETSREFAARMKSCFVLRGSAERKEGGSMAQTYNVAESTHKPMHDVAELTNHPAEPVNCNHPDLDTSLLGIVSQNMQGVDLLAEIRGKYTRDLFFQSLFARPNDFRNFEVKERLISLKKSEKRLLCISKMLIQGCSTCEMVIAEALSDYLELLGVSEISQLQEGTGQLPEDDPQLIIGSLTLFLSAQQCSFFSIFATSPSYLTTTIHSVVSVLSSSFQPLVTSPTIDLESYHLLAMFSSTEHRDPGPWFTQPPPTKSFVLSSNRFLESSGHTNQQNGHATSHHSLRVTEFSTSGFAAGNHTIISPYIDAAFNPEESTSKTRSD